MSDRVGQVLGNYKLLRLLGQGGFSDVYLAEHVHLSTYAAIKILRTQLAEDNLESFRTEARTLAHLKHPNIVQVLDFGVIGTTPYLVMQHALNGTLRQRHPRGIAVALNVVISYVRPMAAALQYAHNQRIIHRDVKPENMLIGEQNQVLLSDFGIAVVASSSRQASALFDPAGTAAYMAPELIEGKAVAASDQYALAVAIYEWLTGELPFSGSYMEIVSQQVSVAPPSLREKVPSLPIDVEEVVMIALNKDPQKRFGRIEAFAQALGQAAQIKQENVNVSPSENIPMQVPPVLPKYASNTGYGIGNYAGPPPSSGQPALAYPNAQIPTYISPSGQPPVQQPNYIPNYNLPQPPIQQPNYTPNLAVPQTPLLPGQTPNYSGFPPLQPPSGRRVSMMAIISAVIAVLLIVAGVVGFFVYHTNQVAQDNAHATATVVQSLAYHHATATVVTRQNATATVVTSVNTTATAVATSPYPSFATVALDNSLTTSSPGWDVNANCKFGTTGYEASQSRVAYPQNCLNSGVYGDIAYQVTMTVQKGDCGGLVFRYINLSNFYYFIICEQGFYLLARNANNTLTRLSKYAAGPGVQKGLYLHNVVAVTLQQDTINLYLNNHFLEAVSDKSLLNTQGQVGVVGYDWSNPTSVLYTNALIWTA